MKIRKDKLVQEPAPRSPLTLSMLTSEAVYKLIVAVERSIRWFNREVIRPGILLIWCLRW